MNTAELSEKRWTARAKVKWPVVILNARGALVAETENISASGAFIYCRAQLRPKEKLKLFIMAPNRSSLNVSAEVAWSNPHATEGDTPPRGIGIRFTRISTADRQFLRDVIAKHHERKIGHAAETK